MPEQRGVVIPMRGLRGNASRSADDTFRPRNLLPPCLLILLEEEAGYGYELQHRLDALLGSPSDTAGIYRALNALEDDGLVGSHWERSESGPERRRYAITAEGRETLADWAQSLAHVSALLLGILSRYECGERATSRALAASRLRVGAAEKSGSAPADDSQTHEELFWQQRMLRAWGFREES
jgi:DNA-binding PadR family transcriptional regulator